MTKEQLEKATELNKKIEECSKQIESIKCGIRIKKTKNETAKENIKRYGRGYHSAEWTLSKFFSIFLEKQKIKVVPHYEFAESIALNAEPELIDFILDYLEKKKDTLEKEFEQIGGGIE